MKPIFNKKKDYTLQNQDWNKNYCLGIEEIDQQHAFLFQLFDELIVLNQENNPFDKLKNIISKLEKYSNMHFQTEETLLKKSDFKEIDYHIAQHQIFKKKIKEFKIAETYKNTALIDQMIGFLRKWLLMHIAEVDKKYIEDVKKIL